MANQGARPNKQGAVRMEPPQEDKKKPWWLWLLLAVVIIALLLFLLSRCGSDSKKKAASSSKPSSSASVTPSTSPTPSRSPTASPSPTATASSGTTGATSTGGTLTVGSARVLPAASSVVADKVLRKMMGKQVTGSAIQVFSVPADEGFWVGTQNDRVWVQLRGTAESKVKVRPGAKLNIEGVIAAHGSGFASRVGVTPAEGAKELTQAAAHVEVQRNKLKILNP